MMPWILLAVGVFFLVLWAVKTLTTKQLRKWGMWLVLGGLAVCVLTMVGATVARHHLKSGGMGTMLRRDAMMKHDGSMDPRSSSGHGADMTMDDMAGSLEGKTGDDFDMAFIDMMIPHHEGAIEMAKQAETAAKHGEIREMARDIIGAQQTEIDRMKQWLKDWGYNGQPL